MVSEHQRGGRIDTVKGIRRARSIKMPEAHKDIDNRRGGESENCTAGGSMEKSASHTEKYGKLE